MMNAPRKAPVFESLCGALMVCALLGASAEAEAQARRYALLIGANEGGADEKPLLYAERDADRMSDVLRTVGGVPGEHIVVLYAPDAEDVERALNDLSRRVEADNQRAGNDESLLFVYYSGHADAAALHLGGTLLDTQHLRTMVHQAPARLRVMIVDACRSGELTRVKGARPTQPFKIDADNKLDGEGLAIITSSAAGEDALESERLGGSFFTHHFVAGLLGPADKSGDGRVTLTEAYRYAYVETLRATSKAHVVQHPTYAFRLKGRSELILAFLDREHRGQGKVKIEAPGTYVFFENDAAGELVAELTVGGDTDVLLDAGRYLVRRRSRQGVSESALTVKDGGETRLRADSLSRVPTGQVVRKGLSERESALGIIAQAQIGGELLPGTGALGMGAVGAQLDLDALSLQARVRYARGQANNTSLALTQDMLTIDASALKLFDVGDVALGFGLRIGGGVLSQRFETDALAPSRSGATFYAGPLLHGSWTVAPWMSLATEISAETFTLPVEDTLTGQTTTEFRLSPQVSLGLIFHL